MRSNSSITKIKNKKNKAVNKFDGVLLLHIPDDIHRIIIFYLLIPESDNTTTDVNNLTSTCRGLYPFFEPDRERVLLKKLINESDPGITKEIIARRPYLL